MNITSTKDGYGLVDNGGGITVTGGAGSVVMIKSSERRPAVGNSLRSVWGKYLDGYKLGKGITVDADKIQITSAGTSIFSGIGKEGKFTVNLNANTVDVTGTISGVNGDIFINPATDGTITLSGADKKRNSIDLSSGSNLVINKDAKALVQITGKMQVEGAGSSVLPI